MRVCVKGLSFHLSLWIIHCRACLMLLLLLLLLLLMLQHHHSPPFHPKSDKNSTQQIGLFNGWGYFCSLHMHACTRTHVVITYAHESSSIYTWEHTRTHTHTHTHCNQGHTHTHNVQTTYIHTSHNAQWGMKIRISLRPLVPLHIKYSPPPVFNTLTQTRHSFHGFHYSHEFPPPHTTQPFAVLTS